MGLLNLLFGKSKSDIDVTSLNRDLQILNDCAKLIENTVTPEVFFNRYDLYLEKLSLLANAQKNKIVKVKGENLIQKYSEMSTLEKRISATDEFIGRFWKYTCIKADNLKTEKGKNNRYQKFLDSLSEYNEKMPRECIEYYTYLFYKAPRSSTINRRAIPAEQIDSMQRIEASEWYKNKIYKKYYSDYPEKPYISQDRELNTDWISQADMFPVQSIIPISMMQRYTDGLLPGHVYMLYWIGKYTNKKIPAYFEYEYGIDFCKEKEFLYKNGFLNDLNKPTPKGEQAIKNHYSIIEKKHPAPKYDGGVDKSSICVNECGRIISSTFPDGFSKIPTSDVHIIFNEIKEINRIVKTAEKLAEIKVNLVIDEKMLCFNSKDMFYEFHDLTPSMKKTKYPLTMHYACFGHGDINLPQDYFGEISYSRDGKIASARLIYWKQKQGYMIHLGTVKNAFVVKKVEVSGNSNWVTKYKCIH